MRCYEAASQEDLHHLGGLDGSVPWGMLSRKDAWKPPVAPAVFASIHSKAVGSICEGFMSLWVSTKSQSPLIASTVHGEKCVLLEQFTCSAVVIDCKPG